MTTAPPALPSATASASATASPSPTPTLTATPVPSPTAAAGFAILDGLPAAPDFANRLVAAVMIDDNVLARPQYGFNQASIVYQAPADGGEDRYMLVFQTFDAPRVEPVRSGRPFFVNWASEYQGGFAHYGGDRKTLTYLPTIDGRLIWDIDALKNGGSIFKRDPNRKIPHNAYTSSKQIRDRAIARGAEPTMPDGVGIRPFADDLPRAERPDLGAINVPYRRGASSYTYDPETNSYLRSVARNPQVDAGDGERVTARNVVVMFQRLYIDPDSEPGHNRPALDHIGTGRALVFRDGIVIEGTWRKASASALTRFFAPDGTEITFVRGRIFIQVVDIGTAVTWDAKAR